MVRLLAQIFAFRVDLNDFGALGTRIINVTVQPLEMALVDDGGVVVIVLDAAREHALDRLCRRGDEVARLVLGHEGIIRREADLSGVQRLAGHDPLGRLFHVRRFAEDDGRLAAKLQRQRDQIVGSRAHDVIGDRRRAGEKQMVESELGESRADIRAACRNGDLFF